MYIMKFFRVPKVISYQVLLPSLYRFNKLWIIIYNNVQPEPHLYLDMSGKVFCMFGKTILVQ